jgi:hypothetical protein
MAEDDSVAPELMLNRFRRLVRDLERGTITRIDFQPWEVDILLDIENFQLERGRREETRAGAHLVRVGENPLHRGTLARFSFQLAMILAQGAAAPKAEDRGIPACSDRRCTGRRTKDNLGVLQFCIPRGFRVRTEFGEQPRLLPGSTNVDYCGR